MIACVIVLSLLCLLIATDPEPGQCGSAKPVSRNAMRLSPARFIGRVNGRRHIYQLTDPSRNRVFSAAKGNPRRMNTPKAILFGLLCASAFLAFGSVAQARRISGLVTVRHNLVAPVDSALVSEVARARAAAALASSPGAASLLHLGL